MPTTFPALALPTNETSSNFKQSLCRQEFIVKLMRRDPPDLFATKAFNQHHIGGGQVFNANLVLGAKDECGVRHVEEQSRNMLAAAIGNTHF
ncbi:MAG: hypothetical protein ACJAXU_002423 [Paracoccaceae bacterium]|jgi:hypothetical protein